MGPSSGRNANYTLNLLPIFTDGNIFPFVLLFTHIDIINIDIAMIILFCFYKTILTSRILFCEVLQLVENCVAGWFR